MLTLLYSSKVAQADAKNCHQVLIGLQPLRYTFASANQKKIADYREQHPGTYTVAYLGDNSDESSKVVVDRDEVKIPALHPQAVAAMA